MVGCGLFRDGPKLVLPPQDRSLTGKLEPVSPPSPPHADPELELEPPRLSKEELIQNMDRVDREIAMVEQQISKLKKKQVWALVSASGHDGPGQSSPSPGPDGMASCLHRCHPGSAGPSP